ncbi:NUDIX domain-containing protein [Luteimonas sp. SX5]|uniref:8-oxo-dGTP diphosphatase n=1 Tax=Luteimonas galliterrae TaxID=2940486 RepID=A0ABT0MIK0_9GAMM|nr:NUDIX domain-containing protein [Luteimonas galliterrae]
MSAATHECVGALLVRGEELLLGRRTADREWLPGAWDVFGGHIESGESADAALRRELREELGIVPLRMHALGELSAVKPDSWRLRLYAITAWSGEPRNLQPDEHDALCWCSLADAEEKLGAAHPAFSRLLRAAIASG